MRGAVIGFGLIFSVLCRAEKPHAIVGSKIFTESYVLAEIFAQRVDAAGEAQADRKLGMGATGILVQSLLSGAVDFYPEYTGTIAEAILKDPTIRSFDEISARLKPMDLVMSRPLGFNNTYALAVRREYAERKKLRRISDLSTVPEIKTGFSHEFMTRPDGLPGLRKRYRLEFDSARSLEHSLAYEALSAGEIELTDIYSTDAKIKKLDLYVLEDDRGFFPRYDAVILARKRFVERFPQTWQALQRLEGVFNETEVIRLNGLVDLEKKSFAQAAGDFLESRFGGETIVNSKGFRIWRSTREHVKLVFVSLLFAVGLGFPLGVLTARYQWMGQMIVAISGLLQTIPSLALLCFLIPLFGIGTQPSLVALFLYGLFPIIVGTATGLRSIDSRLIESARALGLRPFQLLRWIELPLAAPNILAGIRTSAIISIGTATLAALIGAGGYGVPIVTGLAINDHATILMGAIPAAVLALLVHLLFEWLGKRVISKGLQV